MVVLVVLITFWKGLGSLHEISSQVHAGRPKRDELLSLMFKKQIKSIRQLQGCPSEFESQLELENYRKTEGIRITIAIHESRLQASEFELKSILRSKIGIQIDFFLNGFGLLVKQSFLHGLFIDL